MNVVDSSAWLAYFIGSKNADAFAVPIQNTRDLLVPAVCIAELGRKILRECGEDAWLTVRGVIEGGAVIPLDAALAAFAAELQLRHPLPLADSLVYATARLHGAVVWTQDADFKGLPSVNYLPA